MNSIDAQLSSQAAEQAGGTVRPFQALLLRSLLRLLPCGA